MTIYEKKINGEKRDEIIKAFEQIKDDFVPNERREFEILDGCLKAILDGNFSKEHHDAILKLPNGSRIWRVIREVAFGIDVDYSQEDNKA